MRGHGMPGIWKTGQRQLSDARGGRGVPRAQPNLCTVCGHQRRLKTQHRRIDHCPFAPYLSGIFVSEEAGAPKPEPAYFAHVFAHLPEKDRSRMLLIGDSPSSDLLGANRAGIDCCWFAPDGRELPEGVTCTYRIRSLYELPALLQSC